MRRAWPLVLLAACSGGGDQGLLEIHVIPPDRADIAEIELYAGAHDRQEPDDSDYPGPIRPALYSRAVPSVWWERDRVPSVDVQSVANGTAVFRFGLGDENKLESFVAVAFDHAGQPVGMATRLEPTEIPAGEIHRWEMPLLPFDALPRTSTSAPANGGLQVWGPAEDPRACVNVDNVPSLDKFDLAKNALIGTQGDEDCDGLPTEDPRECVSREYKGQKPFASRDQLSCAIPQTVTLPSTNDPLPICVVGGGTCVDGIGEDPMGCHPSSYCLPRQICGLGCTRFDASCETAIRNPDSTRIVCTIPSVESQISNADEFCPATYAVDLRHLIPDIGCEPQPAIRDFTKPFTDQLMYAGGGSIFVETVDAATCRFKFTPTGPVPTSALGVPRTDLIAVFSVPLVAPVEGRGVVVPVIFNISRTGCASAGGCEVIKGAGETIGACVAQPVAPGTQVYVGP